MFATLPVDKLVNTIPGSKMGQYSLMQKVCVMNLARKCSRMAVIPFYHKPGVKTSADGKPLTAAQLKQVNLLSYIKKVLKHHLVKNNEFISRENYDKNITSPYGQFVGKVSAVAGKASLFIQKNQDLLQQIIDKHKNETN